MDMMNKDKNAKLEVIKDLISQMNDVMSERFGGEKPHDLEMEMNAGEPTDEEADLHLDMPEVEAGVPGSEMIDMDGSDGMEDESDEDSSKSLALAKLKKDMASKP